MRASSKKLNPSLSKQIRNLLTGTIADINSTEEAEQFFKDFLSVSEVEMLSKRLAIAYWLKKGRSYSNIKKNLQVSSATIASVQQTINSKGLEAALRNIEADEWASKWARRIRKFGR